MSVALPDEAMPSQFISKPIANSKIVRLAIFFAIAADHVKFDFFKLKNIEKPIINRKKGNTRSHGVIPFHFECCSVTKISFPAPLFTIIMSITVIPLSMSTAISRLGWAEILLFISLLSFNLFYSSEIVSFYSPSAIIFIAILAISTALPTALAEYWLCCSVHGSSIAYQSISGP